MPHLTIEYSANLQASGRMRQLCRSLADGLVGQRDEGGIVYPVGAVRVRALACEDYAIADGSIEAAFVHAHLKIGAGRSEAVRTATGDALFAILAAHFEHECATMKIALSLEMSEFSEAGTWKKNNLHAHFRGPQA